jgi:hypothetical protein
MFARFCGFGPGHKSTRNITQVFRDDIKDAFGLTDNLEVARDAWDDAEDAELEVPGDGDGDGAGLGDVEMDEEVDEESEDRDLHSADGEDDDLHDLEDDDEDEDENDGWLGYNVL